MDQFRSRALGQLRMALDADGWPFAHDARLAAVGMWENLFPAWYQKVKPLEDSPSPDAMACEIWVPVAG